MIIACHSDYVEHDVFCLVYVKTHLCPRDKFHLIMVYGSFNVLLNSVCWYFVHLYSSIILYAGVYFFFWVCMCVFFSTDTSFRSSPIS